MKQSNFQNRTRLSKAVQPRFYSVREFINTLVTGKLSASPAEFFASEPPLPLGTPVYVGALGIYGVISGHSTCDAQRWRVTFFNRHFWRVEHKWFVRSQFEVIGSAASAADESVTPAT